jgi:iron-sulfur cluster assembly accessory protein
MIITEKAAAAIKEISESEGIGHTSVRIKVIGGGCSGLTNEMEYDDSPGELDEVIEIDGITIIIDPLSSQYMEGITMDYQETSLGGGFKFSGGAIKSTCGCGSSFSV